MPEFGSVMKIARIVSSNSHIDYVGRIIDALDADDPPGPGDYGFGQFVTLPLEDGSEIFGVIYDSILVNPDYANYGPRLSPKPELRSFSPDYLSEQGFLIGILLLGGRSAEGEVTHGVPRRIVPAGQEVFGLDPAGIVRFHSDGNGSVRLHYYSHIVAHAGQFALPLLESIIEQLGPEIPDQETRRLAVLKESLAWQRTLGAKRL